MPSNKNCKNCGKELKENRKAFCSPECLALGLKSKPYICNNCGKEYQPIRKSSSFCSLDCFSEHRIKKSRTHKEPDPVPGARWVPLTQGKFTLVDESDYEKVSKHTWCVVKAGSNSRGDIVYAKSVDTAEYLHRYLLNPPSDMEVDHLGSTLDNRRHQLRIVNHSRNQINRYSNGGSSIYKGISKVKDSNKWISNVHVDGRSIHIGYFDTEIEAAKAYDSHARAYFGEQARFNFPGPGERSAVSSTEEKV